MSILTKIFTAIKGGAREAGEAIVDKNSIRIFEQEIKDAETDLAKAKQDLTSILAKEMQAARKVGTLKDDVAKHEAYVSQALAKDNNELALEIAQKIADIESELAIEEKSHASFAAHGKRLKDMIKKTGKALSDMQRQLVMVKTTESVQKATTAISKNYASGSSKLLTAKESLDRIKQKQQNLEDRLAVGESMQNDLEGKDLESKMKEAGIIEDNNKAQDILNRLKAKK